MAVLEGEFDAHKNSAGSVMATLYSAIIPTNTMQAVSLKCLVNERSELWWYFSDMYCTPETTISCWLEW